MPHSNQIREFLMTDTGIELTDIYYGADGLLCGTARQAQEAADAEASIARRDAIESRNRRLSVRRKVIESQIEALKAEFEAEEDEVARINSEELATEERLWKDRSEIARRKGADADLPVTKPSKA
jgi:circadian clock protein KaiC